MTDRLTVALQPGAPARPMQPGQALAIARQRLQQGDASGGRFITRQLIRQGVAGEEVRDLHLHMAICAVSPCDAWEALASFDRHTPPASIAEAGNLANGLAICNRHEEALAILDGLEPTEPREVFLHECRMQLLQALNRVDEAAEECRRALALDPGQWWAYTNLAAMRRLDAAEASQLAADAEALAQPQVRCALAILARQGGDVAAEMAHLEAAHTSVARAQPYPPELHEQVARRIIEFVDADFLRRHVPNRQSRKAPVFVVGMPRSGSTLLEQILATDESIAAIGETRVLVCALTDVSRDRYGAASYPDVVALMDDEAVQELSRIYERAIEEIFTPARMFVDKHLEHYVHLGLLNIAFPEARFIHVLRHPLDTCLSIYQQFFGTLPWSHDFRNIALKYRSHLQVMDHWHGLFGDRIHQLHYEQLIADPVNTSKQLADFVGISWREEMLDFHRAENPVKTASQFQVREALYQHAVAKWRPYAAYLAPAAEVLGLEAELQSA